MSHFQEEPISPLWSILLEISNKQNWYQKVFNEEIVKKWAVESNNSDLFWMAIQTLRSTAQGASISLEECRWEDRSILCKECQKRLKEEIRTNPEKFEFDPEDLEEILRDDNWFWQWECELSDVTKGYCPHPRCNCISPNSKLENYIEYGPLLPSAYDKELKSLVNKLLQDPNIDWHPNSNQQVRDLVHPSLYCYVKGKSKFQDGSVDGKEHDEAGRYQWLPAEVKLTQQKVKFTSYINNFSDDPFWLECSLESFIPYFEKVLHKPLRDRNLQVIVKIASLHLDKEKPVYEGGSWHLEGMPYEHIVATALHYVFVENITDSYLEFRKPVIINEENLDYPQSDDAYTSHHYGITPGSHHEGQMNRYLGMIKAVSGNSVVFPNTLQHRVKDFSLKNNNQPGLRAIIAFFLIDPDRPIISTKDIPDQRGVISREEAEHYRERLMYHRKYFVDELNREVYEREYSLCEH